VSERTKTPEMGPCQQCGRIQLTLAKMYGRGLRPGFVPTVGDDKSWAELKSDHAPGCYWFETRGVRALPQQGERT